MFSFSGEKNGSWVLLLLIVRGAILLPLTHKHIQFKLLENLPIFSSSFSDPTKYFGCELGAQTQFDFKNDRYIVNGSHDAPKLQDMLDGFIRKFVLCENCDNPETDIKVNVKKQSLGATCKACGHSFPLDMRHKLATFILRVRTIQKKFLIWISRSFKKGATSDKIICYFDQFFWFSGLWLSLARYLGRSGQNKLWRTER